MQRKQKKREGEVNLEFPEEGWNPLKNAKHCIKGIQEAVSTCDDAGVVSNTACTFANIEAAFYEEQIGEEEMDTLKDFASHFGSELTNRCKCKKR